MKGIEFGFILGIIDFLLRESPNLALEVMALFRSWRGSTTMLIG